MKNSIFKKLSTMLVIALFVCIGFTQTANAAKLNTSYFWGITANFDASSFDGVVVVDDDGKFDEAYHSFAHATDQNMRLDSLRCSTSYSQWCGYNLTKMQMAYNDGKTKVDNTWKDDMAKNPDNYDDKSISADEKFNGSLSELQKKFLKWANNGDSSKFKKATAKNFTGGTGSFHVECMDNPKKKCDAAEARRINSLYTWPGVADAGDAGAEDEAMINWVNTALIPDFNNAIAFIMNKASTNNIDVTSNEGKMQFLDLAAMIAVKERQAGESTSTVKLDIKISGSFVAEAYIKRADDTSSASKLDLSEPGTAASDYLVITMGNDSIITRWRVPKGYKEGQRLEGYIEGRGKHGDISALSKYTTVEHIAYQGMFNYYMYGQTSLGSSDFYASQGDWTEQILYNIANGIFNSLNGLLNLYSLEDLILNTGTRGVRYWMGVMPSSWFSATQYFYLFTFSLSMIMLLISLVKLAFEKGLSTIGNAARRVSLIEGIKKTIFASIACVLFSSIFIILCQLNYTLVTTISGLVNGQILFNSQSIANGTLGGVIISGVFFFINLKMNFTYMLRGITLLLCYLIGPICIMCTAMGEKYALITQSWSKEVIGNIFIQTVHALVMMVFITVSRNGSQTSIERMVLVYSFIPLTDFIRTKIFALGKGLDDVAESLGSTVGGVALAGTAAAAAGGINLAGKGIGALAGGIGGLAKSGKLGKGMQGLADKVGKVGGLAGGRVGAAAKAIGKAAPSMLGGMAGAALTGVGGLASGAASSTGRGNGGMAYGAMRTMQGIATNDINGIASGYEGNMRQQEADERYAQSEERFAASEERRMAAEEKQAAIEADKNEFFGGPQGIGNRVDMYGNSHMMIDNNAIGGNTNGVTGVEMVNNRTVRDTMVVSAKQGQNIVDMANAFNKGGTFRGASHNELRDAAISYKKLDNGNFAISYNRPTNGIVTNHGGGIDIQGGNIDSSNIGDYSNKSFEYINRIASTAANNYNKPKANKR